MQARSQPRTASCGLAGLLALLAAAPALGQSEGQTAFNNHCRTCHSTKEGDNRLGPSLHNIVGAKAGSVPGYNNYSGALASSGITWDEATLERFLANPEQVVPNNNMKPFSGINDAATRKQIVEFLKTQSGTG